MRSLTLSINTLSVTINRFTTYDRILADAGQTEYAIAGTPLDNGPQYEPKLVWTIAAMVTLEEWHTLGAIFYTQDNLRRQNGNYRVLVQDTVQNFIESGARTRAIASGGVEQSFSGGTAYPAQFYCRMLEPKSQWQINGLYPYIASFTLRELDKVSSV